MPRRLMAPVAGFLNVSSVAHSLSAMSFLTPAGCVLGYRGSAAGALGAARGESSIGIGCAEAVLRGAFSRNTAQLPSSFTLTYSAPLSAMACGLK